jgi:hypothetical protein
MRTRRLRLFSLPGVDRIDPDLGPVSLTASALAATADVQLTLAVADRPFKKPDELTWWDWTVFLLHTAAEIEHALMVQYLYAAYSLVPADGPFQGNAVPENAPDLIREWRRTILGIAREEMAHLLSIQNLLRFVGGPLNLEREDFPFRAYLYPFVLQLEPLTKTSLAKYVSAEMPAETDIPLEDRALIQEIIARAIGAVGGSAINRVGILYDALIDIFEDETKLLNDDLRPQTVATLQADDADDGWRRGFDSLLVRTVDSRKEAVDALKAIAEQGEGLQLPPASDDPSHYQHFLDIYKIFPETELPSGLPDWVPTRPVPRNPNTLPDTCTDSAMESSRITDPTTRLWAHLFNVRYRMLLLDLAHALHLSRPYEGPEDQPTPRGHLRAWAFQEMTSGLRGIANVLTSLPLKTLGTERAGPPFELPYTFALPDIERDRWRLHLALLDTSQDIITKIVAATGEHAVLTALKRIDAANRLIVTAQLIP